MSGKATIRGWAGVARAPFLLLPVALVLAGTGAAAATGGTDLPAALLALLGLTGAHVAVNALNEWSDFRTGIDLKTQRTPFSGGSGTLPGGVLSSRAALGVAAVGLLVALLVGTWFTVHVGWILIPVIAVGAFSILAYTDLLARIGVGEVFAGLGLGGLPVLGTALVQTGEITSVALFAAAPAFFMTFNLLLLNEFPDEEADRQGGRRNLVLLLGRASAARVWAAAALLTGAAIGAGVGAGAFPLVAFAAILPGLVLVPAFRWALLDPDGPVPIPALGANVIWNLATNAILGIALLLS